MAGRVVAIGDIHGCPDALATLIDALAPSRDDTIVLLGDYIDRGPNSRGVLDRLIALGGRCRLVPLLGNHEEALLDALRDSNSLRRWLTLGGADTLRSYGWAPGGPRRALADWFPKAHREFLAGCRSYYETASHLFVHAGYMPDLALAEQTGLALRWRVTDASSSANSSGYMLPYSTRLLGAGKTSAIWASRNFSHARCASRVLAVAFGSFLRFCNSSW